MAEPPLQPCIFFYAERSHNFSYDIGGKNQRSWVPKNVKPFHRKLRHMVSFTLARIGGWHQSKKKWVGIFTLPANKLVLLDSTGKDFITLPSKHWWEYRYLRSFLYPQFQAERPESTYTEWDAFQGTSLKCRTAQTLPSDCFVCLFVLALLLLCNPNYTYYLV